MDRYQFLILPAAVLVVAGLVFGALAVFSDQPPLSGDRSGGGFSNRAPDSQPSAKNPPTGPEGPAEISKVIGPGEPGQPAADRFGRLREPGLEPAERLRLIREAGDSGAVAPLLEAGRDPSAIVRGEAVEALGRIGDARALDPLAAALDDPNPTVRQRAAQALGLLGRREAVPKLLAALDANRARPDGYGPVICQEIVRALGRIKDRGAADTLIAEMGLQQDLSYKNDVVRSLGSIGDPKAVTVISNHLAWLESHKPNEKIAIFPWQEAVNIAKEALRQLGGSATP